VNDQTVPTQQSIPDVGVPPDATYGRATGAGRQVTLISRDWRQVNVGLTRTAHAKLSGDDFRRQPLSSVDPIYMLMLMKILGPAYVVWDKARAVRFQTRQENWTRGCGDRREIATIHPPLSRAKSVTRVYKVGFKDTTGTPVASIEAITSAGVGPSPPASAKRRTPRTALEQILHGRLGQHAGRARANDHAEFDAPESLPVRYSACCRLKI
jgi:hypothetical protein